MNMATIIGILVIAAVLFLAIRYIYKEKKRGAACIGCPFADSCEKHSAGASCDADSVEALYSEIKSKMN